MGNSESSCYSKDEKDKSKKTKKQKSCSTSAGNCSIAQSSMNTSNTATASKVDSCTSGNIECNAAMLGEFSSSSDEAYTPVRKEIVKKSECADQNQWDPRSPSDEIIRTPIQLDSECVTILNDPRSPSSGIDRTPIALPDFESKPLSLHQNLSDPRSPTVEINRTPLNVPVTAESGNLRRAVLLTNTLRTSPLLKKALYNLDVSNAVTRPSCSDDNDGSFYSANNFFVNRSASPTVNTAISPTFTSCDIGEVVREIVDQVCISSIDAAIEEVHDADLQANPQENEKHDESMEIVDLLPAQCQNPCPPKNINMHGSDSNPSCSKTLPEIENEVPNCSETTYEIENVEPSCSENIIPPMVNDEEQETNISTSDSVDPCNVASIDSREKEKTDEPLAVSHFVRKSCIPALKDQERKRRSGTIEKPKTSNKNRNDSALPIKKDNKAVKKYESQSTRSPLSLLGHSNSPEPKRLRQTTDGITANQNKKPTNRSRLPRYKLGHGP